MPVLLPLEPSIGHYRRSTTLSSRLVIYDVRWNGRDEAWYLSLYDQDEEPIALGLRIVLGVPLARRSTNQSRLPGMLIAEDLSGEAREAGFDDLGIRVVVFYFEIDELEELVA